MRKFDWVKPGVTGAVVGAVGLAIVGFTWGGWVTGGTAEARASASSKLAMVNALVPFCVARSGVDDPEAIQTLADLKDAREYQRADILMKAGWATPPGGTADRDLARACAAKLSLAS
ncbi:hypothetical protein L1787_12005 [Acuticoccus sp. M5D2P5]|uniref:hypothetical protein n=1 Tax=Acuticoccus kalidii TaxID=2910977 RepID=UPI001F459C00|nr:hypothetical protein [Acuticoccus kalidii]MCF3934137.1 hypothetical protein [Acuticoccus kalidii]